MVADEIHAPLTLPGATFTPYLGGGSERRAVALVSASKAFNLAGLKASLVVAGSAEVADRLRAGTAEDLPYRCGNLGVLASAAAWTDGDDWLDSLVTALDARRHLLTGLLREHLPEVGYLPPQASYLAWLDCRALPGDLARTPAAGFLARGRVALVEGSDFGAAGAGFARFNLATHPAILDEAVQRMTAALR